MHQKLLWLLVVAGGGPLLVVGVVSVWLASSSLFGQASLQLDAVRELKRTQVEQYFEDRFKDLNVLTQNAATFQAGALSKLEAVRQSKRLEVERYLQSIEKQMLTFSQNRMVVDAMRAFPEAFRELDTENEVTPERLAAMRERVREYYTQDFLTRYQRENEGATLEVDQLVDRLDADSVVAQYLYIANNPNPLGNKDALNRAQDRSAYSTLHEQVHPIIRSYLSEFGYYDIFLVDSGSGDIVYSVFKELDYGTSLKTGSVADSNIGEVFRRANEAGQTDPVVLVDFKQYWPSYQAPAAFVGAPVFEGSRKVGVAIFQFPVDRFNEIMSDRTGLGETGETYLVGADFLMRSNSQMDPVNRSLVTSFRKPAAGSVQTKAVQEGLAGQSGVGVIRGYRDTYVLSAWAPVQFGENRWAILAEQEVAEAFNPKLESGLEFYAEYKGLYGYYDLFLINPDGHVFYTVEREADFGTNLLTGRYADSNLGRLTQQVLETKQAGFADFRPYAPSNGAPAAFIAEPVLDAERQVQLLVALQLPLEAVDSIMQERTGMGETGETYLVGPDFRMRSNSYLDPINHSVSASFAGTVGKNGVRTDASQEALKGNSGSEFITDYNGNVVLSSYAPLNVQGVRWGILAEIDRAEIVWKILPIPAAIVLLGAGLMFLLVLVAKRVSGDITTPLFESVDALESIAKEGDLTVEVEVDQEDEVGKMADALKLMMLRLSEALGQVSNSALEVLQGAESLSTAGHQLSERTTEQAASLEEISSNLSLLSERTAQNADIAEKANSMAAFMNESAESGNQQMSEFSGSMQAIRESTQNIQKIIAVISDIAFQTKMLAINASIEAARAGEHGKGFSVVAEEIQGLAKNTTDSADEIKKLIQASVMQVDSSNNIMEDTKHSLEEIVRLAAETAALMESIKSAAADQALGVNEINIAVEQMSVVTQENSQLAETNASTSNQLKGLASGLNQVVSQFRLGSRNKKLLS